MNQDISITSKAFKKWMKENIDPETRWILTDEEIYNDYFLPNVEK